MTIDVTQHALNELMEDDFNKSDNQLLDLVDYTRIHGVPISEEQAQASFILLENGLGDVAKYAFGLRPSMTPTKKLFDMVNKVTLADRIKGNAKLSNIVKASVSNPTVANADLQPKQMSMKEIGG
jgi:hypothetical protein